MKNIIQLENDNLVVQKSPNGRGVFAKKDFKLGEKVYSVTGPLVSCNEDLDMPDDVRANTYRFDDDMYVSPVDTVGNFFNHSCSPNTKIVKERKKLYLVSIRIIRKGDEVVFDYSTITASDDVWEMKCNCGDTKCRRVVGCFVDLPDEIQKKYIQSKIVPQYIIDICESV